MRLNTTILLLFRIINIKYEHNKTYKNQIQKRQRKSTKFFTTYGFKQINKNAHIGKISKEESDQIKTNLEKTTQTSDTIIFIQLCERCYSKIKQYGKIIDLEEEKYVIL